MLRSSWPVARTRVRVGAETRDEKSRDDKTRDEKTWDEKTWDKKTWDEKTWDEKNATNQNLLRQSFIAYIFRSQSARSKRERKRNPVPIKENYPSPRTCHSLIGCSPSAELTSRGRQSTWSGEPPLAHAQIICLPLRTQLSAPSCNGECGRGSQHLPLSF